MLVALLGASLLLVNRRIDSERVIRRIDGDLLLLLMGLFIVNAAVTATCLPQELVASLHSAGFDLQDPMSMLVVISVLSNIVGNNPSVMLLTPFLTGTPRPEALGAAIALGTGFSSNAVLFGSLAGIIVAEEGRRRGITISFGEFAGSACQRRSWACCSLPAGSCICHEGRGRPRRRPSPRIRSWCGDACVRAMSRERGYVGSGPRQPE